MYIIGNILRHEGFPVMYVFLVRVCVWEWYRVEGGISYVSRIKAFIYVSFGMVDKYRKSPVMIILMKYPAVCLSRVASLAQAHSPTLQLSSIHL